jgi:hypothetical protein
MKMNAQKNHPRMDQNDSQNDIAVFLSHEYLAPWLHAGEPSCVRLILSGRARSSEQLSGSPTAPSPEGSDSVTFAADRGR